MIKKFFALLLTMAIYGLAQVAPDKDLHQPFFYKDSIKAEQHAALTQVNFDDYYMDLIKSEKEAIHKAITMSLVSGAVTGFGTFITIIAFSDNNENKQKKYSTSIQRQTLQIAGIGLTAAGVFGLSYNLYTIIKGTGENSKRASYERAYEIYKRRRSELKNGAKVVLTPTIDIINASAGMQLSAFF